MEGHCRLHPREDCHHRADCGWAPGPPQQDSEDQINAWQLAWDEVIKVLLEIAEEQAYADMTTQQKRPDSCVVSWDNKCLLILKLNQTTGASLQGCKRSLHDTDMFKTALYKPLLDILVWHIPG